jgi:ceramide glucosyltransferase
MDPLNESLSIVPLLIAGALLAVGGVGVFFDMLSFLGARKLIRSSVRPSDFRVSFPPILMIKPVKGVDEGALANFRSFLEQDYPFFEVMFVVGAQDDPAVPIIEGLIREFGDRVRLKVISEHSGTNRKMNNVSRAFRGEKAELIVLNDSDIRVGPSYLKTIVAPLLTDPGIGMVTCFQRGTPTGGWTSRLAALMLNTEAIPQSLVAYYLFPIDFAFGPTMLIRRSVLERFGGFDSLTDVLADDYHLGQKVVEAGYRVHLSDYMVDAQVPSEPFGDMWRHELRWVRTYRNCRPVGYALSILTRPFVFLLGAFVLGWSLGNPLLWGSSLVLYGIHVFLLASLSSFPVRRPFTPLDWALFPVREVLSILLYLGSFGSTITWRGHHYRIRPDGTLMALEGGGAAESSQGAVGGSP